MSVRYVGVQWNRFKLVYDAVAIVGIAAFIALFRELAHAHLAGPKALSAPVLEMRSYGACAFVLLTLILCIGPLARLDRRFLPLVYNRRHLGVAMCVVALLHARHVLGYYQAYSNLRPIEALFTYDTAFTRASLPFQLFGAGALLIVTLMASTSHDFWQRFFGARMWKSLHMLVYAAYALAVLHVAFGALQIETHPVYALALLGSLGLVAGLHIAASRRDTALDARGPRYVELDGTRWLDAGALADVPVDRALPVSVPGAERIAVVRSGGELSAVHGVCAHQGGPLYEGKVIDGCLTCPWHGWQYRPADGCAPPPFQERIPTYRIRLKGGRVLVDPKPLPPGTPVPPARISLEDTHG